MHKLTHQHNHPSLEILDDRCLMTVLSPIPLTQAEFLMDFTPTYQDIGSPVTPQGSSVGDMVETQIYQGTANTPMAGETLYVYQIQTWNGVPGTINSVSFPFQNSIQGVYSLEPPNYSGGPTINPGILDATNGTLSWTWAGGLSGYSTSGRVGVLTSAAPVRTLASVSDTLPLNPVFPTYVLVPQASPGPVLASQGPWTVTAGRGSSFAVTVLSSGTSAIPPELVFNWDFGDGTPPVIAKGFYALGHTYQNPGNYTITITATDSNGNVSAPVTESVTSLLPAPPPTGPQTIVTPTDKIPNFGYVPTVWSVKSGLWSNPSTWSTGSVPTANAVVDIASGCIVTFDLNNSPTYNTVDVLSGGEIDFQTNVSSTLNVGNLEVLQGGTFNIGTVSNPIAPTITDQIVIADQSIDQTMDPSSYGIGLIDFGTLNLEGAAKTSEVTVTTEPHAGDTTIEFASPVSGWLPGDRLIFPDTRQLNDSQWGSGFSPQWESATVASVASDGLSVTLTAPLQFDHLGARDASGTLRELPQVMDMTRNVTISSANPNGTRGHVMITDHANADIRYVGFTNLGRTTNDPLDNTTFNSDGSVAHYGANQIGRYPLHIHHLAGPATPTLSGYNFTLVGNAIDNDDSTSNAKWGVVVHGSNNGLIQDNNVYNVAGAGIVTEDGTETGNVFDGNMVVRVAGLGGRPDYYTNANGGYGREGSGFWFAGVGNTMTNNIVSDVIGPTGEGNGFMLFCLSDANTTPILEFSDNTAYGATLQGMEYWGIGSVGNVPQDIGPSVIQNLTEWHITRYGIYPYPSNNVTIEGYTFLDDPKISPTTNATGIFGSDYLWSNTTIDHADIEGALYGIVPSVNTIGPVLIENSYLANNVDLVFSTLWYDSGRGDTILPRQTFLLNDQFNSAINPQATIFMQYGVGGIQSLVTPDTVLVENYNDVIGDNFQVYYNEEAANYIVPQSVSYAPAAGDMMLGSPVAGLTNAQNWDQYGIAIAGAVAPTTATTRPYINGLVSPMSINILNNAGLILATVPGSTLTGANLSGLKLTGANLSHLDLTGTNFTDCMLDGANFDGSTLTGANFNSAFAFGASFQNSNCSNADFTNATLTESVFDGASTTLVGATVTGWNINYSSFRRVNLSGINFGGNFYGVLYVNFTGANFTGANLHGLDLSANNMTATTLTGVTF
jgi:uncharacterized protein YjbI with pentapeptide repeats